MPVISIIVPVFNVEKYINRCIDSILGQTFHNFELLLIDDGSSDTSGMICDEYAVKDQRITVIHSTNHGLCHARNKGIELATGQYIMFCDSDDWVEPEWCEQLYYAIREPGVDLAFCGISSSNNRLANYIDDEIFDKVDFLRLDKTGLLGYVYNKVYKKDIIDSFHLLFDPSMSYAEDSLFAYTYFKCMSGRIKLVNEGLYQYDLSVNGSLSKRFIPDMWATHIRVIAMKQAILTSVYSYDRQEKMTALRGSIMWAIHSSINNIYNRDVLPNRRERLRVLNSIVCSAEYQYAMRVSTLSDIHPVYRIALKMRNAPAIDLIQQVFHRRRIQG